MTKHPTLVEIEQYTRAELRADDLLRVDDHLALCEPCRQLAAAAADAAHRIDSVIPAIQADLAAGSATDDAPARVIRIAGRSPAARALRWTAVAAAAASAALAANLILSTRSAVKQPAPAAPAAAPAATTAAAADRLTADERRQVDDAIASGRIERPALVDALRPPSGALMGGAATATPFAATRPAAVAVDDDRPTFEWTDAGARATYRVMVYDEAYSEVAASGWIRDTQWTADRPLPRGKTFTWTVTARIGTTERTAPAPPQPETRFLLTSDSRHTELAALRRRASGSHLALAVLLARAGVLDEAERELTLAAKENRESTAVQRLEASLRAIRER